MGHIRGRVCGKGNRGCLHEARGNGQCPTLSVCLCEMKELLTSPPWQVPLTSVCYKTLVPEGGAFGVADSICNYLEQNDNDMLVVGNRGLGTLQR